MVEKDCFEFYLFYLANINYSLVVVGWFGIIQVISHWIVGAGMLTLGLT